MLIQTVIDGLIVNILTAGDGKTASTGTASIIQKQFNINEYLYNMSQNKI